MTQEINSLESESGIIATLLYHPDFIYHSDRLQPSHFTSRENQCIYTAIGALVRKGVEQIDTYGLLEALKTMPDITGVVTAEYLNTLFDLSAPLVRHTPNAYKEIVSNVLDAALRRDTVKRLKECESMCSDRSVTDLEQKIYTALDETMLEFSSASEVPMYKDVVDDCWREIEERQKEGFAGVPFKFKTLNEYATLESGELFIFAAGAKEGKSIMALNCTADLLKKDKSVLYVDSELNTRLFTARMIAHLTGIEYRKLTTGTYTQEESDLIKGAIAWLKTRNFTHIYMPIFDQQNVYTTVQKVSHTSGLDVLVIDYFKSTGDTDAFGTYQELGRFVDMIKNDICGRLGIAGLGIAQCSDSGKLADSQKIVRNASTIAIIQPKTENELLADGEECGNKKLRIVYNRNGMQHSAGDYIDLKFDGNHILYEEAKQHISEIPF